MRLSTTLYSLLAAAIARAKSFHNPIISGFAPDPSCIRVSDQFFCVTSSFSAFPGIPVYTSKDLVQWEQIGNVLAREEQLPGLTKVNTSTGGIWAATIRHHDDTFYVTTTLVRDDKGVNDTSRWDNVIFTSKDPFAENGNGWSDPVHFDFNGYDTSLFWDFDGKVYVVGSHYHRISPGIIGYQIDLETGASLSGDAQLLWVGTNDVYTTVAPEGPHIYAKDGFYYLLIAEGGTGIGHEVTMARSNTSVWGPYDPCPYNPVFTNVNTTEYLQTVGHADVFNDPTGNWWSVALATRNATVNYPMGRETVLVPVVWDSGEFPIFNGDKPGRATINMTGPLPPSRLPTTPLTDVLVGAPQHVSFAPNTTIPRQFIYFRFPNTSAFSIDPSGRGLQISGSAMNISGPDGGNGTSTFLARRQDHLLFSSEVTLEFNPKTEGEEAGITLFIQRLQHFDLGVVALPSRGSFGGLERFIRLRTITANSTNVGMSDPISKPGIIPLPEGANKLQLKVQAVSDAWYEFSFAVEGSSKFTIVGYGAASQVSGGYTGTLVGMFATGNGRNSTTPAFFKDFTYVPVQGVY